MSEQSQCRSCGAKVLFIHSKTTGALMILDAEPVPDGNVAIVDEVAWVQRGDLFEAMLPAGPRYKDHHATCPDAKKLRETKKKKR